MENEGHLFEEYAKEKTITERMKNPKFWIKYILIIVFLVLAVMVYKSFTSTWSKDDVENSIEIASMDAGWMEGKSELRETATRILPFVSFRVKNKGKAPLHYVNFECVFEFQADGKPQTSGFCSAFEVPLPPGDTSDVVLIKGVNGYTATSKEAFYQNKDKWKKVNAKLFARTQGSTYVRVGDLYPVEQKITGFKSDINVEEKSGLADKVEILITDSGWIYKVLEGKKVLVYPSIKFKIRNTGDRSLSKLAFKGIFLFEKSGERFNFGYPVIKKDLTPGSESKEITMRSEYGIHASSLQALYNNIFEWDEVKVRIMIKDMDTIYEQLGEYLIKKEIEGVKVINDKQK